MKKIVSPLITIIFLGLCAWLGIKAISSNNSNQDLIPEKWQTKSIAYGRLRHITFSLVSSAENSDLNYLKQYQYIEDIGDGRGYTGGIIGFTSGTGDMLQVVKKYLDLQPTNNKLKSYIPALEKVNGTPSHKGLGKNFVTAWKLAAKKSAMIKAQNYVLNKEYLEPAIKYAKKDGLSPLGQYIYYDALVVHGPGNANEKSSFQGIRSNALKSAKTPKQGGTEKSICWPSSLQESR